MGYHPDRICYANDFVLLRANPHARIFIKCS